MAHYLVTGGAGFIGSHLCDRLLAEGHTVTVLDDLSTGKKENLDERVTLVEDTITREGVFDTLLARTDGVFHLAAVASVERSRREWMWTHEVNLSGMVRLLDAIARSGRKIPVVYASSAAIYGNNPNLPLKEAEAAAPATAYGVDKYACELHAAVGAGVHGIPSLGFRFFNVYGARQDPSSPYSGVVSIFMERIPVDRPITLFGDGMQTRDFIYVGDVVSAVVAGMLALHEGRVRQDICNVCTGNGVSLKELIAAIESISGKKAEITVAPARTGDIKASLGDARKLESLLGLRAQTSLEAGLKTILDSGL